VSPGANSNRLGPVAAQFAPATTQIWLRSEVATRGSSTPASGPFAALARLMRSAKNEQTRVAAAKELLDRGYGKATQPLANDPENQLNSFPRKIEIVIVDPKTGTSRPLTPPDRQSAALRDVH